jgi:hypothetical protein
MTEPAPGFFGRLGMAIVCFFALLFRPAFAQAVLPAYRARKQLPPGGEPAPAPEKAAPPEKVHASGLAVLAMLQREGRLIDFLQEEVAPFSDADVGAAARIVHEGCRKVVRQYLTLTPVLKEGEGASVTVPAGFDAERIRLTGNVTGAGPFKGQVKHHGWVASEVKLPVQASSLDPRVIAPAEVELP